MVRTFRSALRRTDAPRDESGRLELREKYRGLLLRQRSMPLCQILSVRPTSRRRLCVGLRRKILAIGEFIVQPGVLAMEFQEALVRALFNNATMIKNQYLMRADDRA